MNSSHGLTLEPLEALARTFAESVAAHVRELVSAPEPHTPNGYLDIKQAMAYLGGMSERQLRRHVTNGEIRAYKPAGRLLFKAAELDTWVQNGAP
jgi:excisionase family DNA binding protein